MIKIGNRIIGADSRPFLIAEMSGNHNQSLERMLEIVDAAAQTGTWIKTPDLHSRYDDDGFGRRRIPYFRSQFFVERHFTLQALQEAYTPWEWHKPIFDPVRDLSIIQFNTTNAMSKFRGKSLTPCA